MDDGEREVMRRVYGPYSMRTLPSRRGWAAGVLATFGPGLGHIYAGEPFRGWRMLVTEYATLVAFVLIWVYLPVRWGLGLLLVAPVMWALHVAQIRSAVRAARRASPEYRPRWYNRFSVYALYTVLCALMLSSGRTAVEFFKIPSASMAPGLFLGDHVTAVKMGPRTRYGRGDIVVFHYPREPDKDFAKRIVAIGGDTVELRGPRLFVNGEQVGRRLDGDCTYEDRDFDGTWIEQDCEMWEERLGGKSYRVAYDAAVARRYDLPPTTIPEGKVFVLGDNRDNSHDSRFWGTVPADHVVGTVTSVWASFGPTGVRWERVGLDL